MKGAGVDLFLGDPDELDRLARELRTRADIARELADDQVRRAAVARWVSDEAELYRDQVGQTRRDVYGAADRLDDAAAALQAHANVVRERLAVLARLGPQAIRWVSTGAGRAIEFVEVGVDGVVDTVSDGIDAVRDRLPWP